MSVTHKPKVGALLTGTEYEASDSHIVDLGLVAGTDDPTAGLAGSVATIYRNTSTGSLYIKIGAGDTDWVEIVTT